MFYEDERNALRSFMKMIPEESKQKYTDLTDEIKEIEKKKKRLIKDIHTRENKIRQYVIEDFDIGNICKGCGGCCAFCSIDIKKNEYNRIVKYLKEHDGELEYPAKFYIRGIRVLKDSNYNHAVVNLFGGSCVMFTSDRLCAIHPVKPDTCAKYKPSLRCIGKYFRKKKRSAKS